MLNIIGGIMTKAEFIENVIFHIFKDRPYGDSRHLKTQFTKILNCEYEDQRVTRCFVKITNYQIKKYGRSLYNRDATLLRR